MEIINSYHSFPVAANIEEPMEDIRLMIKYNDHGDDFIFVSTKDGKKYEYGWYCNRSNVSCFPSYEDIQEGRVPSYAQNRFLRTPMLNRKYDKHYTFSNSMYFYWDQIQDRMTYRIIEEIDISYAKSVINVILRQLEKAYDDFFVYDVSYEKSTLLKYAEVNGVNDPEVLSSIENAKWSSGKDGYFGSAGKIDRSNVFTICGDKIEKVFLNGKEIPWRALKGIRHTRTDRWGVSQFVVKVY